jgi:mRNA interferase MazF
MIGSATSSITICAFTSDPTDAPLFRLVVEPTDANGLETISRLMVDEITRSPWRNSAGASPGSQTTTCCV